MQVELSNILLWSARDLSFKCLRCTKKAAQNLVGDLFRKSSGKLGADLIDNRRRTSNEVLQEWLGAVALADLLCCAVKVPPQDVAR
jgi:hypothetical protein